MDKMALFALTLTVLGFVWLALAVFRQGMPRKDGAIFATLIVADAALIAFGPRGDWQYIILQFVLVGMMWTRYGAYLSMRTKAKLNAKHR